MIKMRKYINLEIEEGLATVTIDGLKDLNLLNWEILDELSEVLDELKKNNKVRVVIITGKGEKAFSSGADLHVEMELNESTSKKWSKVGQEITKKIENLPVPVIGAINGYALGGGMEIAMTCDILIAFKNAKFSLPEVKYGVVPGWGGTQRLTKIVGKRKAMEMILTGDMIDADEAYRIGLVNRVVKKDLIEEAKKLAKKIMDNGPISIKYSKKLINKAFYKNIKMGLETDYFSKCFLTEDQKEGMTSFFEKRKPKFKGR